MREFADDPRPGASIEARIVSVERGVARLRFDRLATEEPLEIRLRAGGATKTVAITMRTPGNDFELAAGFLFSEGVVTSYRDIAAISFCIDRDVDPEQRYNIVNVDLARADMPALDALERHFITTSACGVCGKASIEALRLRGVVPIEESAGVDPSTLCLLPDRLRAAQGVFAQTGGLHAAALYDLAGEALALREDVGRHNALDKLIGWSLLQRLVPLQDRVVMVSGRTSYEIVQKALVAGVPVVCAVSAPSSLAMQLARAFNVTLVGFLRGNHFNVYAGEARIRNGAVEAS